MKIRHALALIGALILCVSPAVGQGTISVANLPAGSTPLTGNERTLILQSGALVLVPGKAVGPIFQGTSSPPAPLLGTYWWNTTTNPNVLNVWDGAQWVATATLNTSTHAWTGLGALPGGSGTSGGIPYFNSGSSLASSGALSANGFVLGGGAGSAPTTSNLTGLVVGNGSSAPAAATIDPSLSLSTGTLALNLAHANTWSGTQTFSTANAASLNVTGQGTTTYTVGSGGQFTTVTAALASINQQTLPIGVFVVLNVLDGGTTEPAAVYMGTLYGKQIQIQAQHTYTTTVSSIQSSSGSVGAWSVILNVASVANLTTSMDVAITAAAGGTNPTRLDGDFAITNVDAVNTRITVTDTNRAAAAPSGAVTANVQALPRITFPTNDDGIDVWNGHAVLNINGVSLVGGGGTGNAGLSVQDLGRAYVTSMLGVRGFGADGVLMLYNSQINGGGFIVSSGNGMDGIGENWGGSYDLINTVSTGNGNNGVTGLGGGNMSLADSGTASVVSGNGNAGVVATVGAVIHPGAIAANDNATYGLQSATGGMIDAASATESGNGTAATSVGQTFTPFVFVTPLGSTTNVVKLTMDGGNNGEVVTQSSSGATETNLGQSAGIPNLELNDSSGGTAAFLSHNAAGAMTLGTTNGGTNGLLQLGTVSHTGVTVSALPSSPIAGEVAYITDGNATCTAGATPTGGGSNKCFVGYNGSAWKEFGI